MATTRERRARPSTETLSPIELARAAADAMFRSAEECCHQHDRVSKIVAKSLVEEEIAHAQEQCSLCDDALATMVDTYSRVAGDVRPQRQDDSWWRCANTLWLASREYASRNRLCDLSMRELKEHGPDRLGKMHADYELAASALLGLRQAAENYRKCRPAAS